MDAGRTSNLVFTEKQDRGIVSYCKKRVEGLRGDNQERFNADRFAAEAYENNRRARASEQGVFEDNNLVLPLSTMIAESFISRAEDATLGQDPFFQFKPQAKNDDPIAQECDAYFRYKFGDRQAKVRSTLAEALKEVFLRRSLVFKVGWEDNVCEWLDRSVTVLHDKGKPVRIPDPDGGDPHYVTDDDAEWEDVDGIDEGGQATKQSRLKLDPSVLWDPKRHSFAPPPKPVMRSANRYVGANAKILDSDAFMCPSTASSIEKADFKCDLDDQPLAWVKTWYIERDWQSWDSYKDLQSGVTAKAKSKTDRNEETKENLDFDLKTKSIPIVYCWVRRDVLGWDRPQEFMVMIDTSCWKSIYYEFQAKLCPDLKSPYQEVSVFRYKGRWWGMNLMEKLMQYQDYIDKQFNRHSARNAANANPIGGFRPDAVEEEPDDIELGDGGLFRLRAGKNIQDFIQFSNIPNLDLDTQDLIKLVREMVQSWLARSNLAQGDTSDIPRDMPQAGIKAALTEGTKIDQRWTRMIISGFEDLLRKMVRLQADQLDEAEVYEVTDGEGTELATMTPEQLKKLEVNVNLVMGQKMDETTIQAAEQALNVQQQYFDTPDPLKKARRPIFTRILERLGYKDIDTLLPLPADPAEVAGGAPPGAVAGAQPGAAPGAPAMPPLAPFPAPGAGSGGAGSPVAAPAPMAAGGAR